MTEEIKYPPAAFIDFHGDLDDDSEPARRKFHNLNQAWAHYFEGRLRVHVGDLTEQIVDAIVNAANRSLMGGSGVDGAIHRAAGQRLTDACAQMRDTIYPDGLPTGEAVMTTGGNLPARRVIHTVGPVYGRHDGREAELLAACYRNTIALAMENNMWRIAFPAISTGVYGYPPEEAARVVFSTLREILASNESDLQVRLVFLTQEQANIFIAEADQLNGAPGGVKPRFL